MTRVTSVRLSEEMLAKLDQLAASIERPRSWLIEQAIERYVEDEAWQVTAIGRAYEDYKAGKLQLVPHEDVVRRLDEKIRAKLGDVHPLE